MQVKMYHALKFSIPPGQSAPGQSTTWAAWTAGGINAQERNILLFIVTCFINLG